jgi:SAM-dependent methyltransferase
VVDALFASPRLAEVYDPLDPDRGDLDAYVAMVEEFGAASVVDLGCGTGTLACLLAARGISVVGVDPAAASLAVARRKTGAEKVRWVYGDARAAAGLEVDLVTMTGNVAQVFVDDEEWHATLGAIRAALGLGGRLVFETRDPARRAWEGWTRAATWQRVDVPGVGEVDSWIDLTEVTLPLVSFRTSFVFSADGPVLTSDSTLRFRDRAEVAASLAAAGFVIEDVRDAPDRPSREMVFVATTGQSPP